MNVELFPCSGGMAEGFRRAGVVFDVAFDYSADACASYEQNHGHRPVQMDVRDLVRLARAGFAPGGTIDLLVADPPCTPWSRAGKRQGRDDERDMLEETVDLIEIWRPRAYLIGNVPGLDDSTQWHNVQEVLERLRRIGYCTRDYATLDAADYGVPQHRRRPFWFGHLAGPCIRWPSPSHCAPHALATETLPGLARLLPWVTCREALAHLPLEQLGRPVRMKIRPPRSGGGKNGGDLTRCSDPDGVAKTVVAGESRKGGQILIPRATSRHAEPVHTSDLDAPARALTTQCRAAGHATTLAIPHERNPISQPETPSYTIRTNGGRASQAASMLAWPWARPATTIQSDERLPPPPGHHDASWKDANGERARSSANAIVLSEVAAAILQGFPETWRFIGATKTARWAQIGMAMPPGLAEPVARAIVEQQRAATERAA